MAGKSSGRPERPFVQFSKKMVVGILALWGIIRCWSVVAVWLRPAISEGMVRIIQGVDDIATVIVLSYTGNSISEKIATGYYQMRIRQAGKDQEDDDKEKEQDNG